MQSARPAPSGYRDMARKRRAVPSVDELILRTAKLRRELRRLLKRFPEDHVALGERIFIRLFDPVWRNQIGDVRGPYERKQAAAIRWLDEFDRYLDDLRKCVSYVACRPKVLEELPVNRSLRLPAGECIERLELQERRLKALWDELSSPPAQGAVRDRIDQLRERLGRVIDRHGVKHCAAEAKLNPDTLRDFLSGKINRPRRKTVEVLQKFTRKHDC
jgi:hypothetical protein